MEKAHPLSRCGLHQFPILRTHFPIHKKKKTSRSRKNPPLFVFPCDACPKSGGDLSALPRRICQRSARVQIDMPSSARRSNISESTGDSLCAYSRSRVLWDIYGFRFWKMPDLWDALSLSLSERH